MRINCCIVALFLFFKLSNLSYAEALPYSQVQGSLDTKCLVSVDTLAQIECGRILVEQNHFESNGRYFSLPYLQISPIKNTQKLPPLIFVNGGPGGASFLDDYQSILWWRSLAETFSPERTFIVLELRGSKNSEPTLDCPELHSPRNALNVFQNNENGISSRVSTDSPLELCRKRLLREGIDLTSVNRLQIAHDIKVLAEHLGARKVALLGVSYGTTYAMTVASMFPDLVSALVLDSVYPPEATKSIDETFHFKTTLKRIFKDCLKQTACEQKYPEFEKRFFEFLEKLDKDAIEVPFENKFDKEDQIAVLDSATFLQMTQILSSWDGFLVYLPDIIFDKNDAVLEFWVQSYADYGGFNQLSFGAYMSAICFDLPQGLDIGAYIDKLTGFSRSETNLWAFEFCDNWNTMRATHEHRLPLNSKIPALLLNSEFDPLTPPHQALMAEAKLPNSYYFQFPRTLHALSFSDRCAQMIIRDFLKETETKPNGDCLANQPDFVFN